TNTEEDNNTLSLATSYTDLAGNAGTAETTANYAIDTLAPTVSSVAITSASGIQNSFVNAGDNVLVTVTFSENSTVTGTPQLTLAVGEDNHTADYTSSGSGATTKVFTYTIQAGDNDTDGIRIGENALALNSGTIRDAAGNYATNLDHIAVSDNENYMVDTTPPTVSSVAITSAEGIQNSFVNAGDNVSVTATFSERVIVVSGTPTLTLVVDSTDRAATYASGSWTSGSGSTPLVFRYTIQAGDTNDTDGISIGENALNPDNITVTDLAGNIADDLTHDSVDHNGNFMVDTTAPTVISFDISDDLLTKNETMTVDLVFSEPVCAVAGVNLCAIVFSQGTIVSPTGTLTLNSVQ
ncbi:uncharacterized protein METZ01_LOCUS258382, partial [marine metagenome]